MKTNQVPIIAAFAGLVVLLLAQSSMPVHAKSSFAGTWEGKMKVHDSSFQLIFSFEDHS